MYLKYLCTLYEKSTHHRLGRGLCTLNVYTITSLTTVEPYQQPGHYDHLVGVGLSTEEKQTPRREGKGVVQQHTKFSEEKRKTIHI